MEKQDKYANIDLTKIYEYSKLPDKKSGRCDNCDGVNFKNSVGKGSFYVNVWIVKWRSIYKESIKESMKFIGSFSMFICVNFLKIGNIIYITFKMEGVYWSTIQF